MDLGPEEFVSLWKTQSLLHDKTRKGTPGASARFARAIGTAHWNGCTKFDRREWITLRDGATLLSAPKQIGQVSSVTVLAAASMAYNQIITVAFGIFLGGWLGAADFGVVNLARTLFTVTLVLAPLGLDLALQRSLGRDVVAGKAGEVAALRLIAGALSVGLALALAAGGAAALQGLLFPHPQFAPALVITMFALPFATDTAVLGGAYRGLLRPSANLLAAYVVQPTARVALVLALAAVCERVTAAVLGTTLSFAVAGLWMGGAARADFPLRAAWATGAWAQARAVLSYAPALGLSSLAFVLARSLDTLTLAHFAPAAEVGRYAIALMAGQLVTIIGSSLGQTLGARIAAANAAGDRGRVGELLRANMGLSSMVAAPFCVAIALWGRDVDLVLGPSFVLATSVMVAVSLTQWVMTTTHYASFALSMTGRHRLELGNNLAALAVQAVACVLLIPRFGMLGAAVSTLTSVAFINVRRQWQIAGMLQAPAFDWRLLAPLALSALVAAPVYGVYAEIGFRAWWVTGLAAATQVALSFAAILALGASAGDRAKLLSLVMRRQLPRLREH